MMYSAGGRGVVVLDKLDKYMPYRRDNRGEGYLKSILLAHSILFIHIFVLAGVGVTAIFLKGLSQHLFWVLMGGAAAVGASSYILLMRLRSDSRSLREMLKSPLFRDRNVEISLLGGAATIRIVSAKDRPSGRGQTPEALPAPAPDSGGEGSANSIHALDTLRRNGVIDLAEYNRVVSRLYSGRGGDSP